MVKRIPKVCLSGRGDQAAVELGNLLTLPQSRLVEFIPQLSHMPPHPPSPTHNPTHKGDIIWEPTADFQTNSTIS